MSPEFVSTCESCCAVITWNDKIEVFLFDVSCHIITFVPLKATLSTLPPLPSLHIATLHKFSAHQVIAGYNKISSHNNTFLKFLFFIH